MLQELLLGPVLQAEQVVHVLLSKQTHREGRLLPMGQAQLLMRSVAVVLRQGAAHWEENLPCPMPLERPVRRTHSRGRTRKSDNPKRWEDEYPWELAYTAGGSVG